MTPGIFARTFVRPSVEEVFAACALPGLRCVQFNFSSVGLPTLADHYPPSLLDRIHRAATTHHLAVAAVSGTWNMIHPDPAQRLAGLRRLPALLEAARQLGAPIVTLCTGSRDATDMWRAHPDNRTTAAWDDLCATLEPALAGALRAGVTLGIEPESSNVIHSALQARRLLDHFAGAPLGIVIDPANLLEPGVPPQTTLAEAFSLLGDRLVLAHAKEWSHTPGVTGMLAAGAGQLDWDLYLSRLADAGFKGPLILHGFAEADAAASVAFLLGKLAAQRPAG